MKMFSVYDDATGEILRSGQCADADLELQAGTGQSTCERTNVAHHDGTAYVDLSGQSPVITARPAMGATISGMTISNIPVGAVLTIEGIDYTVNDGEAELTFNAPGTYQVKLALWPRLDQTFEVIAP